MYKGITYPLPITYMIYLYLNNGLGCSLGASIALKHYRLNLNLSCRPQIVDHCKDSVSCHDDVLWLSILDGPSQLSDRASVCIQSCTNRRHSPDISLVSEPAKNVAPAQII